ncbi:fructose-bisphosphate aldolase [Escherichia coli]|uniref:fructose-bisphosphate aldolase n=1 Tax=Escherichia coli TaxID=562 RepID=A0A377CCV3_ECOLX|nr:fructose-bisphosphate aldolase [Escherichia coli]
MTIPSDQLYLPGHDYVDRVMIDNNRPPAVLRNMQTLYNTGRLAGTGYLSILPVDQGVEHSAGASFAANPLYFDPKNIVELAIEAGCNCVASTYGVLASVSRRYAHRIPFLVKLNHNETLSYPNTYDQTLYASVEQAFNMARWRLVRLSILARKSHVARLKKFLRLLNVRTSWAW